MTTYKHDFGYTGEINWVNETPKPVKMCKLSRAVFAVLLCICLSLVYMRTLITEADASPYYEVWGVYYVNEEGHIHGVR